MELTKEPSYKCPLGKSDHVIIEIEIDEVSGEDLSYKESRRNYGKAKVDELKKFYEGHPERIDRREGADAFYQDET